MTSEHSNKSSLLSSNDKKKLEQSRLLTAALLPLLLPRRGASRLKRAFVLDPPE